MSMKIQANQSVSSSPEDNAINEFSNAFEAQAQESNALEEGNALPANTLGGTESSPIEGLGNAFSSEQASSPTSSPISDSSTPQQGQLDPELAKMIVGILDKLLTGLGIPPGSLGGDLPTPQGQGGTSTVTPPKADSVASISPAEGGIASLTEGSDGENSDQGEQSKSNNSN